MTQTKAGNRQKRIPRRICIACRSSNAKRELVRLVRTAEGVEIDPTGKKAGRGAYLCNQSSCWQKATNSRIIEQALRIRLSETDRSKLIESIKSLTAEAYE